jgi:GAF domain-containing protein
MLRTATWLIDFTGLALSLWLAAYLFSRGMRSAITRGATLIFLLLAIGFLIDLYGFEAPGPTYNAWWALVLTAALLAWYRLTRLFLTPAMRRRVRWMAVVIYGLGVLKMIVLAVAAVQNRPVEASTLNITPYTQGLSAAADVVFLLTAAAGTLANYRLGSRAGIGPHSQALWIASVLGALAIAYGAVAILTGPRLPRVFYMGLLLAAVVLCGYTVARYQAFIERRTMLRDLPVSAITVFGLAGLYAWLSSREGFSPFQVSLVVSLAIVSHAAYDVVTDLLDSLLLRRETHFRRRLRSLARDAGTDTDLPAHLIPALETLVQLLGAAGGFIAVRREAGYAIRASVSSLSVGTMIDAAEVPQQELGPPGPALGARVAWLAPAFAGEEQVAVIALGQRLNRGPYSDADLDLLADLADWVGRLVDSERRQSARRADLLTLASAVQSGEDELQAQAQNLMTTLEAQPDREFARHVEQALQRLSDPTTLGQSPLVDQLHLPGTTHIERGKALRERLLANLESLRPSGARPSGVLPREWHSFAILHDAYVEDVPNREIQARLYISEGDFNRKRRKALQAVARALYEAHHAAPADEAAVR